MKWSLKLGKLFGGDLYLHFALLLLLGFLGFYCWNATRNIEAALLGVAFIVVLFGCVVLHEPGHVLMARRYDLLRGLAEECRDALVTQGMCHDYGTVDEASPWGSADESRQARQCSRVPVAAGGKIVGLLTMENISDKIMLNTAMAHQASRPSLVEGLRISPQGS